MKRKIFTTGIMAALFFSSLVLNAQDVGNEAPAFSYSDLNDTTWELSAMAGKVVFIYTFGNGCPYCKASGPDTESKVQQVYGDRSDFQALGLDTWNHSSSTATVGAFKSTTGITYPLCPQAGEFEQLYSTTYDRLLVIDQEGILRHKGNSNASNDLDAAIAVIEGLFAATSVGVPENRPVEGLSAVYPNPSADFAGISFTLESETAIDLRLYNLVGQEIYKISKEILPEGEHHRDVDVSGLSPGMYLVKLETRGASYTRKLQVAR